MSTLVHTFGIAVRPLPEARGWPQAELSGLAVFHLSLKHI